MCMHVCMFICTHTHFGADIVLQDTHTARRGRAVLGMASDAAALRIRCHGEVLRKLCALTDIPFSGPPGIAMAAARCSIVLVASAEIS